MNYLTVDNISKSYGDNILFENIDLHINKGEKVALIARNGAGKSSLLRILSGKEKPEGINASVLFHPAIKIGILDQEPHFEKGDTIWETLMKIDKKEVSLLRQYQHALLHKSDDMAFQKILTKMDEWNVWSIESDMEEILSKLSLPQKNTPVDKLSGGQRKRLALARLLIEDPDFFILDEPTNHLDLSMIEWLQNYLSAPDVTVLLITHDRYFLENICDVIFELSGNTLYKYMGNYSDYLEKKSIRETNQQTQHQKNVKLWNKEKEWIHRMPKARGTKNKARIQNVQELKKELYAYQTEDELSLQWKPTRLGSKIIELQYINKSLGDKLIVKDFNYKFKKGDRLGIIGPNGSGKTTLLNLITKAIDPDGGKVVHGLTVQIGHYKQDNQSLDPNKTVLDTVKEVAEVIPLEKGRKLTAKQLCEHFLFSDNKQRVYVAKLSGGEKRRLYLLTILMQNPNVLILDEPTNDLDIMTLNVLEEFLLNFPGVLIVVSHDRYFMDKIVDHLFVLEGNGYIRNYPGNYTQYREDKKNKNLPDPPSHILKEIEKSSAPASKPKALKSKDSYQLRKEINRLENRLLKLEQQKESLMSDFENSADFTQEELLIKQASLKELDESIESIETEWLQKVEELE